MFVTGVQTCALPISIDILAELGETVLIYQERAKALGITLNYYEPKMLPFVYGDSDEICRVMQENGAKFCDVIPLTLNEIFIYEMEGQGYDSSKLDR